MKKKVIALWNNNIQLIKFLCIGASNAVIAFIVNAAVLYLFDKNQVVFHTGDEWNKQIQTQISSVFSFLISSANGYVWNKIWVFKGAKTKNSLAKFYASYGSTFLMGQAVMALIIRLGVPKYLAPIPVMATTTILNFLLSKFWAFRNVRDERK